MHNLFPTSSIGDPNDEVGSIMIGDNLDADIQGAINAGMDSVYVNHINGTAHVRPTYTIYHLKELELIF